MTAVVLSPDLLDRLRASNQNLLTKEAFTPQPAAPAPPEAGGLDPSMGGGAMPGGMPGAMPGGMPGAMPGGMPGAMPGMDPNMAAGMPGAMPAGAPAAAPGAVPGQEMKPKKVDPAVMQAQMWQLMKMQVLIASHLGISIPPEMMLGIAPDPMALQQAAADNQMMETQTSQSAAGLPQAGAPGGAPGGAPADAPKTAAELSVHLGSGYSENELVRDVREVDTVSRPTEAAVKTAEADVRNSGLRDVAALARALLAKK